jgi:hypothetical protein
MTPDTAPKLPPVTALMALARIGAFLRPYRRQVLYAAIALIVAAGAVLAVGQGLKGVIDRGFGAGNADELDRTLALMLAVVLVMASATFTRFYFVSWIGERVTADLRRAVFEHLLKLPPAFFELTRTGEVISRLTNDTAMLETVIGSSASMALRNLLLLVGGLAMLAITSLKLTLLVLAGVPLVVVPILLFGRRVRRLARASQDRVGDVGAYVDEALHEIRTVQAYGHEPVDRARWFTTPHLVNTFAGSLNEIVFPAAILQPPFFYADADDAVNYGAIGSVIGHEITHHFDDRGRQFDSVGNLNDWWAEADAAAYRARAARLAQQYSEYSPLPGRSINGQQTLGENISDLGGVKIAYDGLQLALARKPVGLIDGLTQDQRFFISFAIMWRSQYRTEAMMDQLQSGQHSPNRYRVLGPLANFPAFGKAFACPPGAPMLRAPADQITIW